MASAAASRTITFVTGNAKKLEEVAAILGGSMAGLTFTNKKLDLPELQGDPLEVATEKCRLAMAEIDGSVL